MKRNFKFISLILIVLTFAFSPIIYADVDNSKANSSEKHEYKRDGKTVSFLITLNKNEIAAARLALKKHTREDVKSFAQLMIKHHTQNLEAIENLSKKQNIQPINSAKVLWLKHKGKKELAKLSALDGNAFDKAYINAMVKGHSEALNTVNKKIKHIKNPELKRALKEARMTIVSHLNKALEIQQNLQKNPD